MKLTTSYQREINNFCKIISEDDYNIKEVTAGALTQARTRLNPWVFIRLNSVTIETFYSEGKLINGMITQTHLSMIGISILSYSHTQLLIPYQYDPRIYS